MEARLGRMAKLDRLLTLVNALHDTSDGLTLDEMAEVIDADRRTAERLRDVVRLHFDLEVVIDDRRKRFRISQTKTRSKLSRSSMAASWPSLSSSKCGRTFAKRPSNTVQNVCGHSGCSSRSRPSSTPSASSLWASQRSRYQRRRASSSLEEIRPPIL